MSTVGIRQLKQNASEVIALVKAGEAVEVTERGAPVALIIPVPGPAGSLDRLVAEGRATKANGNLADLPLPLATKSKKLPSQVLDELRAEER